MTHGYGNAGRLTFLAESTTGETMIYGFDPLGRLTSLFDGTTPMRWTAGPTLLSAGSPARSGCAAPRPTPAPIRCAGVVRVATGGTCPTRSVLRLARNLLRGV